MGRLMAVGRDPQPRVIHKHCQAIGEAQGTNCLCGTDPAQVPRLLPEPLWQWSHNHLPPLLPLHATFHGEHLNFSLRFRTVEYQEPLTFIYNVEYLLVFSG